MTGVIFVAVVSAAVIVLAGRRWRRARLRRAAFQRPGASIELAIPVRSYTEMDEHLRGRWCHCGGFLERAGEGTREANGRRYRVARLRCQECEDPHQVFFDVTDLLH